MGDLFLRDLKPNLQKEYIGRWKFQKRKDLLKAYEAGEDISIGEYYRDARCEVV